jgi:hypothetical protein
VTGINWPLVLGMTAFFLLWVGVVVLLLWLDRRVQRRSKKEES